MNKCLLCEDPCSISSLKDFCCLGCQTVYQILKTKGISEFQKDPLYLRAKQSGWLHGGTPIDKSVKESALGERYIRQIEGMWCSSCSLAIEWLLAALPGVLSVSVDYATDLLVIRLDPLKNGMQRIEKELACWGYSLIDPLSREKKNASEFFSWKIAGAAFFSLNTMMLSYPAYMRYLGVETQGYEWLCSLVSGILTIPVIPLALWPLGKSVWVAARAGYVGSDLLMLISSLSAILLSSWRLIQGNPHVYFDTAWVILALQLLGKGLEKSFKVKNHEAVLSTLSLAEAKVRLPSLDGWKFTCAKDLKIGQEIGLIAGDLARIDAVVESGRLWVDLSWERGEALPVELNEGELIRSGMMVVGGSAIARVHSLASMSQLQIWLGQLAGAIEKRKEVRSDLKSEQLINSFTFLILILSCFSAIWVLAREGNSSLAFERAMSVLVISCPCSLGIALPLVRSRLVNRVTQLGFWLRRPWALEQADCINNWFVDKTGTLTYGRMDLVDGLPKEPLHLGLLKAIAMTSAHPICVSIQGALREVAVSDVQLKDVKETFGVGVIAKWNEKTLYLGKPLTKSSNDSLACCEFYLDDEWITTLYFEDSIRPEAQNLVKALKNVTLLSGDQLSRCKKTSQQLNILNCLAEKTSLEKAQIISSWKKDHPQEKVAMIGDGLNDALAMQQCDLSIAIACDKSDPTSALHWADIALIKNDLKPLFYLIDYAKLAKKIRFQNLFISFFYNIFFVPFAVLGYLSPLHAAIAMLFSSFSVLINSWRI